MLSSDSWSRLQVAAFNHLVSVDRTPCQGQSHTSLLWIKCTWFTFFKEGERCFTTHLSSDLSLDMIFDRTLKYSFLHPDRVCPLAPWAVLGGLWETLGRRHTHGEHGVLPRGELWHLRLYRHFAIWTAYQSNSEVEARARNHHKDLCKVQHPQGSDCTTTVSFAGDWAVGGESDISSIASGGWTICLPYVLAMSVVTEENTTMGEPPGQRKAESFYIFDHSLPPLNYSINACPSHLHKLLCFGETNCL